MYQHFFSWKLVFLTHWNLCNGLLCTIVSFPLIKASICNDQPSIWDQFLCTAPATNASWWISSATWSTWLQFLKTGDYKYKANCSFNHPKLQSFKSTSCAHSNKSLPLRPVSRRPNKIMIQLTNSPLIMWCLKYILLN